MEVVRFTLYGSAHKAVVKSFSHRRLILIIIYHSIHIIYLYAILINLMRRHFLIQKFRVIKTVQMCNKQRTEIFRKWEDSY